MPSFNSLPDEILKNHILSRFSVFPPDEYALAYRAVCKKLYKMVPLEDMLSINRDTIRWMLGGKPVVWEENMNSYSLECTFSDKYIDVSTMNCLIARTPNKVFNNHEFDDTIVRIHTDSYAITVYVQNKNATFDTTEKKAQLLDLEISGSCSYLNNEFFMLGNGTFLHLPVSESESINSLETLLSGPQKQIQIPERSQDTFGRFACKSMNTLDGLVFWFLDSNGNLDIIHVQGSNELKTVATSIASFRLIDSAAVCLSGESIKLVHLKTKGQELCHFTTTINTEPVIHFEIFPQIKSMWFISTVKSLIRHGESFVLSHDYDNADTETNFSASALHAKLKQAQAKLKNLIKEK
jgi:hypothetical protein